MKTTTLPTHLRQSGNARLVSIFLAVLICFLPAAASATTYQKELQIDFLPQYNKRWIQQISMMFSFFFFFLLTCVFSTSALATVNKNLHFEWQFDTSYPGLAGYRFFKDGVLLVTINNPTALSLDYTVALEENRSTVFTMKSFDITGKESPFSEPYTLLSAADVNHDQNTDLKDLILVLQVLTNTPTTSTVYSDVDVGGNGRIGIEEAIKCLKAVATI